MIKIALVILLLILAYTYIKPIIKQKFIKVKLRPSRFITYYGAPGVGKSTWSAYLADRYIRSGIKVYSNLPIQGCYKIDKDDIGKYLIENCLILWDECGTDFNSRSFKTNFTKEQIRFWKYHRHEGAEIAMFSQGFDDMDKILRTLCTEMYVLRRSFLPYLITAKPIRKMPSIDENTHQPIDYYDFRKMSTERIFAPLSWKLFNSYERLGLPAHDFPLWGAEGTSAGREPAVAEHQREALTDDEWSEIFTMPVGTKLT